MQLTERVKYVIVIVVDDDVDVDVVWDEWMLWRSYCVFSASVSGARFRCYIGQYCFDICIGGGSVVWFVPFQCLPNIK